MKKYLYISIFSFLAIIIFSGCEKNVINYGETEPVEGKALVKINNVSMYRANPGIMLSVNNNKVSNLITARTPFPGGGLNTGGGSSPDYLALAPGNHEVAISIPKRLTNIDSIVLFKTNVTLDPNKNYTLHITDTAADTKTVLVTDDFTMAPVGKAKHKFINLMPNVPGIDLYFGTTKVATNIEYLKESEPFLIDIPASSTAWTIREAGTAPTSTALATYTSASTYLSTRVYTAFALGYKGLPSTDPRRPFISFFFVR